VITALLTQLLLIFSNPCGAEMFHVCSLPRGKQFVAERVYRTCFAFCKWLEKKKVVFSPAIRKHSLAAWGWYW